MSQTVIVLMV